MQKTLSFKLIIIGLLCLIFCIGFAFISGIVEERKGYHQQVMNEIARDNVRSQTLVSPFILIPKSYQVCEEVVNADKSTTKKCTQKKEFLLLTPKTVDVAHQIKVSDNTYKRGIYKAITYDDQIQLKGSFNPESYALNPNVNYDWSQAKLYLSVSDPRGIMELPVLSIGGKQYTLETSTLNTVSFPVSEALIGAVAQTAFDFELKFSLSGMDAINVVPLGKQVTMRMQANWPHPGFVGDNLPYQKQIRANGFSSIWQSSYLGINNIKLIEACINQPAGNCSLSNGISSASPASAYEGGERSNADVMSLGVQFVEPINIYSLTDRTLKYALLLLLITFGTFFLFEALKDLRVHPIQYGLVGLAQAVFYLLLLSFSEQFNFLYAYIGSSIACIVLITWYISFVLHGVKRALGVAVVLTAMYATMYTLLSSQQHTLMLGSVFVFVLITLVMFLTRHIDWYRFKPVVAKAPTDESQI
jgi:inner membrane protein